MAQKNDLVEKNETKIVKVTVVVIYNGNGTYFRSNKEDPVLQILEPILLAVLCLIAFAINMFLLVTILSSFTLRKVPFNTLLVNISFACLPECLFNILIAVYYATTDSWKLGSVMCSISAFTVQMVTLEITFGLCIMCAEGSISLWRPSTFQNYLTVKKQVIAIVTLRIAGLLLCLPLLVGSISVRAFPSRYGCSSAGNEGYAYNLFLTVWCYVIPVILGFCSFIYLGIRKYKDYKARKSKKNDINYSDILFQGDLWTEWVNIKLVSLIALFFIMFVIPYIVINQMGSLKTYADLPVNGTLPIVVITPNYETTFTWFRYLFVCMYPVLVFWMRKDIRRKLQSLLRCCQKNNTSGDHSPLPVIKRENKKKKKDEKKEDATPLSLTTPILYISPDGLCLRQLDSCAKLTDKSKRHLSSIQESNWTVEPSFVSYLCDVNYTSLDKESSQIEENIISDEISRRNSNDSEVSRRNSNESEVSAMTLEKELANLESSLKSELIPEVNEVHEQIESPIPEVIPNAVSEPVAELRKPKRVRFAETLTIYKSITPTFISPSPDRMERSDISPRPLVAFAGSKIPTRYQPENGAPPWKVEMNETYRVRAPVVERKRVRSVISPTKSGEFMSTRSSKPKKKRKSTIFN